MRYPTPSKLHLQHVTDAVLTLLVDEILALGEVAACKLGHNHRLAHRNDHRLPIQIKFSARKSYKKEMISLTTSERLLQFSWIILRGSVLPLATTLWKPLGALRNDGSSYVIPYSFPRATSTRNMMPQLPMTPTKKRQHGSNTSMIIRTFNCPNLPYPADLEFSDAKYIPFPTLPPLCGMILRPLLRIAATTATFVPCHSSLRLSRSSCSAKRLS